MHARLVVRPDVAEAEGMADDDTALHARALCSARRSSATRTGRVRRARADGCRSWRPCDAAISKIVSRWPRGSPSILDGSMPPTTLAPSSSAASISSAVPGSISMPSCGKATISRPTACLVFSHASSTPCRLSSLYSGEMSTWLRIWVEPLSDALAHQIAGALGDRPGQGAANLHLIVDHGAQRLRHVDAVPRQTPEDLVEMHMRLRRTARWRWHRCRRPRSCRAWPRARGRSRRCGRPRSECSPRLLPRGGHWSISRSVMNFLKLAQTGIEHVAQPVADDVDGKHQQHQRGAGKQRDPPLARQQQIVAGADQRAERGL